MGCIHTSDSNKSRIIIRVRELKYIYIFNQSVICRVRGLEAIRHLPRSRVRGYPSFAGIEVERVKPASKTNTPHLFFMTTYMSSCVHVSLTSTSTQ